MRAVLAIGLLLMFTASASAGVGNCKPAWKCASSSPPATILPTPSAIYGSAINADTLGNTQIGGTNYSSTSKTSYRFRAEQSANLVGVRVYFVTGHAEYSGGNGGNIEVTLQTDAAGAPSGTVLSTLNVLPGNADPSLTVGNGIVELTFSSPAAVVSGQLYHLVFRNIDPNPGTNFSSVDGMFVGTPLTPRQPRFADADWAQLINTAGTWSERPNYSPIMDIRYSNGAHQGMGYANAVEKSYKLVNGTAGVRETFTGTGNAIAVRLGRASGSSPLTIRVETPAGSLVEEGTVSSIAQVAVPGSGNPNGTGATWATLPLSVTLSGSYNVVLSTLPGTAYWITPLRKGGDYNFAPATYFADGYAQQNTGGNWTGVDADGQTNSDQFDWQWYLR